jgi:hypothetical protein
MFYICIKAVLWDVTPYIIVEIYLRFGGTWALQISSELKSKRVAGQELSMPLAYSAYFSM